MNRLAAFLLVALASINSAAAQAAERLPVLASFSILGDLVGEIGGDRVQVSTLVGPNTDMHVFQPTPADARRLLGAKLVVINGLGFEGWADRLVSASGYAGPMVVASRGVKPLETEDDGHGHSHGHGHTHNRKAGSKAEPRHDPHAWQDVGNVKLYVANIRDGLIAADPVQRTHYESRAADYLARLDALDREIRATFWDIGERKRRVITSHDAFAYFGRAYGIKFSAPQGVSGDSEPSAKAVAALIRQIKREGVNVIFVETISNPRVIQRIAKETGARLGPPLYSDALSDANGPAPNYAAMMRHNARALADSMR